MLRVHQGRLLAGGELCERRARRVLVHDALAALALVELVLDGPHLALAVQAHEAHKVPEAETAGAVVVEAAQEDEHLVDVGGEAQMVEHVVELDDIDVLAPILIELDKRRRDFLHLSIGEAVPLVEHAHEVHEGVVVELVVVREHVPLASLLRLLDHGVDGGVGQGEAELRAQLFQLIEVHDAVAARIRFRERLAEALKLLIAQPPRPDQRLRDAQAEWRPPSPRIVHAPGPLDQLLRERRGFGGVCGAEELRQQRRQPGSRHHVVRRVVGCGCLGREGHHSPLLLFKYRSEALDFAL
mmetsp:Transcript_28273/g.93842  ORF Transcript_28273/g.93842 Transcript_28273/m.93842 type:complete len:298 (+) Transcript_28273:891-1784(+)